MGKKGGSSWLTLVKNAFRSPSKDPRDRKSNIRRDKLHERQEEEEEKQKREKKRWLFRKHTCGHSAQPFEEKIAPNAGQQPSDSNLASEQRHAIAVAAATAQAALEIIRLARPPTSAQLSASIRKDYATAATIIQTAFRGYLARRALQALRGIVKLQALVRGHNVRKQAKSTLKCMEALIRVQNRVRHQRARLSYEGSSIKSMFAESNSLPESNYLQERKSIMMTKARSSLTDDWDECPHTLQELDSLLQARKQAAMRPEKTQACAFSQQIWDSGRNPSAVDHIEREIEERANWLDQWMASKQWESSSKESSNRRELIKTVEIDTFMPHRYSSSSVQRPERRQQQQSTNYHRVSYHQPPVTPSPSKMRPLQIHSASPRSFREERSCSTSNTPSLGTSTRRLSGCIPRNGAEASASVAIPNYMATTESAKARLRSQSAPRQRPSTPERERERGASAKKRLLYHPVPNYSTGIGCGGFGKNLRSPSFKSVQAGYVGMEQGSNESIGGELVSPCSTTDLRRWFK
ncbi:protein IQ-DOMAIN 17-like [Impatiens glandulifera]|uniref:protein IQ-DOMAIN 17-like n=1 Tax=Impatiens glandulifera TaxID=253017 RepID=UPI001FB191BE|nr:protein IQ-DOMAIN 17-like [Impatiens glandulifera]